MDLIYAKLFFQEVAGDHNVKAVVDPGDRGSILWAQKNRPLLFIEQ